MCKFLEDRDCVLFVFELLAPSTGPGGGRWVLMMATVVNGDTQRNGERWSQAGVDECRVDGPNAVQEGKLGATAVTGTSDGSFPVGSNDVLVEMHPGEAPSPGKGRQRGEEELLSPS